MSLPLPMPATMMDDQLSLASVLRHGATVHGQDSEVVTFEGEQSRRRSFAEIAERAEQLGAVLQGLGITPGDRVATFGWNNSEHLECYLAIPAMGAVLHTLNIRLFPEQLVYIANHAEDQVIVCDASLVPLLAKVLPEMTTVKHVLVTGDEHAGAELERPGGPSIASYEAALAAQEPGFAWLEVDERSAAAMCYTSGTTGNPKGVVYSHRSVYLHSMAVNAGGMLAISDTDRVLPIVPMFHANAWGLAHAAWMAGADLLLPDRFLQAEPLSRFIAAERPTVSGGVPTVFNDLLHYADNNPVDLSSLRMVACGGSAVPRTLMEGLQTRHGVYVQQAWGMTETSPCASVAKRPKGAPESEEFDWRITAGRILPGVAARIVDENEAVQPADGTSVGEVQVRGPWVTGDYYGPDDDSAKFSEGWLRTGDVGTLDGRGYITLTDRAKDMIKSGGEWISSVELENEIMSHPDVLEAAVVGVPDEKWQERPLATVVAKPGVTLDVDALKAHLSGRVAKWQVPERWAIIAAVPRTSVGKFDKKVIRKDYADGRLDVVTVG